MLHGHEALFKQNPRMGLTLKHVAKMTDERRLQITDDAKALRQRINQSGSDVPKSLETKFKSQQESTQQGELF